MKTQNNVSDALLKSRIQDAVRICRNNDYPQFLGFLDERQKALSEIYFQKEHVQVQACYWGGYPDAVRTVMGIFPEDYEYQMEDFPIVPLEVLFTAKESLSHRDFLGSLMGLGMKREAVGDILVVSGKCVVFVSNGISEYILTQWIKVGRTNIKCSVPAELDIPQSNGFSEISGTVASSRLDCVIAAVLKVSRSSAVDLITERCVCVDFLECTNAAKLISGGRIISVRGDGKYIIDEIGPMTKKGRFVLKARKYL